MHLFDDWTNKSANCVQFYQDMRELGVEYVLLNATFPDNYPFAPPFVRVVSPHIEKGIN